MRAFDPNTIRPGDWNHGAHVLTAAYFLFEQGSFHRALVKMKCFIIDFGARRGNMIEQCGEKYNETITCFWVKYIADYIGQQKITTLESFVSLYAASPQTFSKDIIYNFYTKDELHSDLAKAVWIQK